jgi:hypothetical protein
MTKQSSSFLLKSLSLVLILMSFLSGSCQQNQKPGQKANENSQPLSDSQTRQIKSILAGYNAARLTAADAKAIQEKFRQAGIHAGPETNSAITAAGFDPEKLRTLAPPPNAGGPAGQGTSRMEVRVKKVDEQICVPLAFSASQKEAVSNAFREFYTEMEKLPRPEPGSKTPPDKSKVEPLEKARDAKIKKLIPADQYTRYLELEKAMRNQKAGAKNQKAGQAGTSAPSVK